MWKMTYMHLTDRITRNYLYKYHGKESNMARDPICLWLMSLYGYWLRILYVISYFYNQYAPMALSQKHIGSCATGTAHYHVPQNGHFSLNV